MKEKKLSIGFQNGRLTKDVGYPYLVVRSKPNVYSTKAIEFKRKGPNEIVGDSFIVNYPEPFQGETLRPEVVHLMIQVLKEISQETNLRMCLFLSEERSIHIDPDGTTNNPPAKRKFLVVASGEG